MASSQTIHLRRIAARLLPVLAAGLSLAGCSLFEGERRYGPDDESTLPFLQELSARYSALADAEEAEHDWRDAGRYRDRAERARYGEFVAPEAIDYRDLPPDAVPTLTAARARLVRALDDGAPLVAGVDAARAQAAFDCWMQEQEEGHQTEHIGACREAFAASMTALADLGARSVVVLLPDPDGALGAVELAGSGGSQRLATAGAAGVMARNRPPESAGTLDERSVQYFFGDVLDAQPEPPVSYTINFITGTDEPTAESDALLPEVLDAVRERTAPDITVIGHSDRQGDADANYRLALRRAEKVAQLIYGLGVPRAVVEVRSFGETDPLVPTADGVAEARNRRVEISIR